MLAIVAIFVSLDKSLIDACDSIPDILDIQSNHKRTHRVIRFGEPRYSGRRQYTQQAEIVQLPLRLEMPQPVSPAGIDLRQAA